MIDAPLKRIYVDPPSSAYYEDRLFDHSNSVLNRDDTLAPFIRLRTALDQQGVELHTADRLLPQTSQGEVCDYYSFGILDNFAQFASTENVNLKAFVIFEPPVVDPRLYNELPRLTAMFDRVYIHNTDGDGYSLEGVDQSKLCKLYWPQPHNGVLLEYWGQQDRQHRIVMINGNHKPMSFNGELYSKRIQVLAELANSGAIDLYGRGWERWWSRGSMWLPYWRHRKTLMSLYHGACESKYVVLSKYSFALCFENMYMKGYITEKIFDCLYAGAIPIYLGAKDISDLIPEEAYIDFRMFTSCDEMWRRISNMTVDDKNRMREAGRAYLDSREFSRHHDSLISVVNVPT
jgi:hypothetical protein